MKILILFMHHQAASILRLHKESSKFIFKLSMYTFIFDWKRTLYDPDTRTLILGAKELLSFLKNKRFKLVLIGKGDEDMYEEVDRLGVKHFFDHVQFKEGAKSDDLYTPYITANTIFIGDRVRSELAVGKKLNARTIWIKQGKFANEEPENSEQIPDYTVQSLLELLPLLQNDLSL